MSYTITTTAGSTLTTIADGTINQTSTGLTLVGKNYAGYGVFLNQNYVKLLENFSNGTAPVTPLAGQLWHDRTNGKLKFYSDGIWKSVGVSSSGSSAPTSPNVGDNWWDTTNSQLKVWSGTNWTVIGPAFTSVSGTSGALVETITDNAGDSHIVVKFYVANTVLAILSKDPVFTPQTAVAGFATIKPGFNLVGTSTVTGAQFTGTASEATNALSLGGVAANLYVRSDQLSSNLSVSSVSIGSMTKTGVDGSGDIGQANNRFNNIYANNFVGNITSSNPASVPSLTKTGTDGVGNIGQSNNKFGNVYATYFSGTAITANYADLAERFAADRSYAPGTVVALGGVKEITAVVEDLSDQVFGVISTRAGFLMNGAAGDDQSHPPVAVNGRVPVRVVGAVKKGDRLVSAGNGLARAAGKNEATAFNVIGRSLEDKEGSNESVIEAIVKLNS